MVLKKLQIFSNGLEKRGKTAELETIQKRIQYWNDMIV
jgi:hypothetical protein